MRVIVIITAIGAAIFTLGLLAMLFYTIFINFM